LIVLAHNVPPQHIHPPKSKDEGGQRFLVNQDLTSLNKSLSNDTKNR
jgi:hypothetical protein